MTASAKSVCAHLEEMAAGEGDPSKSAWTVGRRPTPDKCLNLVESECDICIIFKL
jgi:hypothetical protein